ncbi:hypothetical protein [Chryseobacterium sp. CT-SW4]|uniref:hypothetical protein n=1 Tax=Chryseobacterium sp. SW-1 TaxID=3157343 RepID=UPI003B02AF34
MKTLLLIILFFFNSAFLKAQSCKETLDMVKAEGYGSTYFSPSSKAISQVTFYEVSMNYKTYHFAVVKFTSNFYKEYIYLVGSNTKYNYSINYLNSAGEAFWKFIAPYNKNLGCGPDF